MGGTGVIPDAPYGWRPALSRVRSRTVWYFHGFDPATTARYRRIFAGAAARFEVDMNDLPDGGDGWQVVRAGAHGETRATIRYARYEDLVRDWRAGPLCRRILRGLVTVAGLITSGALRRMVTPSKRQVVLALSPAGLLLMPTMLCLGLVVMAPLIGLVLIAVLTAIAVLVLRASLLDIVFDLFAYMAMIARGEDAHWERYRARIDSLASGVARGSDDEADEEIIVGHSLGGIAAILTTAGLLEQWPAKRPLGLLTLGSVHGVVLAQQGAGRDQIAKAIAQIAADDRVSWIDVTSPHDAFCLPLTDPLAQIGALARPGMTSPRVISAQLRDVPAIPGDRRTGFSAMRRHMGYLLAPQVEGGFDYADVITGDIPFSVRFKDIANSPKARMWQS